MHAHELGEDQVCNFKLELTEVLGKQGIDNASGTPMVLDKCAQPVYALLVMYICNVANK